MTPVSPETTTPTTPTTAPSRLPSLDGWRAASIFLVLGAHSIFASGFPAGLNPVFHWIFDGSLGVRFFFVISGFLITWLILHERERTGSVSLRHFYVRRCLRILPVYFMFLAVLAGMQGLGWARQSGISWFGNLTFTRNVFGGDALSAHLWSLSVEEQFYLLWPGFFLLAWRAGKFRSVLWALFFLILLGPYFRGLSAGWYQPSFNASLPASLRPVFPYGYTIVRHFFVEFDALAFGCLCAVLLACKRELVEKVLKARPGRTFGTGVTLILVPHILTRIPIDTTPVIQFGNSLQALGFSILVLHSVIMPGWGGYRFLNLAWVRQIGVLSYSLYIWQQLFWGAPGFLGLGRVWWMGLWLIPLFTVATISYYGLERPLLKLRSRYRDDNAGANGLRAEKA